MGHTKVYLIPNIYKTTVISNKNNSYITQLLATRYIDTEKRFLIVRHLVVNIIVGMQNTLFKVGVLGVHLRK